MFPPHAARGQLGAHRPKSSGRTSISCGQSGQSGCRHRVAFLNRGRRGARLKAGLPEPEFADLSGAFVVTFRQSRLTREDLAGLGLSGHQIAVVKYLQAHGRITNRDYVALTHVARPTATRDLADPVARGLVRQHGRGGAVTLRRYEHIITQCEPIPRPF
jgi:hypothetical protein